MSSPLPFNEADPAHLDCQYLEDLSTAYWYSEVLFAAIELRLFSFLEQGHSSLDELSVAAACRKDDLERLLKAIKILGLIHQEEEGLWINSQTARKFLLQGHPDYMGDFLLYRKYMRPRWQALVQKTAQANKSSQKTDFASADSQGQNYALRTLNYVKATDALVRQKSREIAKALEPVSWQGPVLDVGGGAGTLARTLLEQRDDNHKSPGAEKNCDAILLELPEVIVAAKKIYTEKTCWDSLRVIEGDFRSYTFDHDEQYGLILLSNFLHAYGPQEARQLLAKAIDRLKPGGHILIHDYFPDRCGRSPQKGTLYDLNMMLNTYDGRCHDSWTVKKWLQQKKLKHILVRDLSTDTSIIVASNRPPDADLIEDGLFQEWIYAALEEGFQQARLLPVKDIETGSWVRKKCRFGCEGYGRNLQCPPYGLSLNETKELLASYSWCLVLEGMPPGSLFHKKLLSLEKRAFLAGHHKAFAFGAGPCPVCDECSGDNVCRHPDLARPSMEASGIDVYETAKTAGISLKPVQEKGQYVKYIGLLLLR